MMVCSFLLSYFVLGCYLAARYNCECSDSFVKLQHTKQLKFERLFVDCNMDTQEHAHGRCDGHAVPVYIGSSPEFAKEYNAWLTEKAAVDFIHMEAQMILDEDWVQHSLSTRVLLGSEVSCPPVGDEPPDCDTHLRRLLSSCESKSEDHTVTCNSVCASYLCDEKVPWGSREEGPVALMFSKHEQLSILAVCRRSTVGAFGVCWYHFRLS